MQDELIHTLKLVQAALSNVIEKLSHPPQQAHTIWPQYNYQWNPNSSIATAQPAPYTKPSALEGVDEPLASPKQSKMLFAVSQALKLTSAELNSVLETFNVFSGWSGDVPAALVNDCKKAIEQFAAQKEKDNG